MVEISHLGHREWPIAKILNKWQTIPLLITF